MANAGAIPIASAKMKQKNAFVSLPRVTMWEREPVLAVAAPGVPELNCMLVVGTKVLKKICRSGCMVFSFLCHPTGQAE
jgi:hypothetical protein